MRTYIKKLQAKEETVRKQIFAGLLIVSMVFVGFIWIYNLGNRFEKENKEQVREDVKPFKLFANSISDTYKNISASVGNASVIKDKIVEEEIIDLILIEEATSDQ